MCEGTEFDAACDGRIGGEVEARIRRDDYVDVALSGFENVVAAGAQFAAEKDVAHPARRGNRVDVDAYEFDVALKRDAGAHEVTVHAVDGDVAHLGSQRDAGTDRDFHIKIDVAQVAAQAAVIAQHVNHDAAIRDRRVDARRFFHLRADFDFRLLPHFYANGTGKIFEFEANIGARLVGFVKSALRVRGGRERSAQERDGAQSEKSAARACS